MKKNQEGFGVEIVVAVIVAVAAIGGVGYAVYQRSKKPTTTNTSQNTNEQANTQTETTSVTSGNKSKVADSTQKTSKLVSLNKKFALTIPDGWVFTNDTELDYAYATSMTYKKGETPTINNTFGHRGGGFTNTSFVIQYSKDELKDYFSASEADGVLKLNNGKEAKKYFQTINNDELGIPDGSKSYGYQVGFDGGTIIFSYLVNPADTNQIALIEASIKTLEY